VTNKPLSEGARRKQVRSIWEGCIAERKKAHRIEWSAREGVDGHRKKAFEYELILLEKKWRNAVEEYVKMESAKELEQRKAFINETTRMKENARWVSGKETSDEPPKSRPPHSDTSSMQGERGGEGGRPTGRGDNLTTDGHKPRPPPKRRDKIPESEDDDTAGVRGKRFDKAWAAEVAARNRLWKESREEYRPWMLDSNPNLKSKRYKTLSKRQHRDRFLEMEEDRDFDQAMSLYERLIKEMEDKANRKDRALDDRTPPAEVNRRTRRDGHSDLVEPPMRPSERNPEDRRDSQGSLEVDTGNDRNRQRGAPRGAYLPTDTGSRQLTSLDPIDHPLGSADIGDRDSRFDDTPPKARKQGLRRRQGSLDPDARDGHDEGEWLPEMYGSSQRESDRFFCMLRLGPEI
jgi:hypothetical protein